VLGHVLVHAGAGGHCHFLAVRKEVASLNKVTASGQEILVRVPISHADVDVNAQAGRVVGVALVPLDVKVLHLLELARAAHVDGSIDSLLDFQQQFILCNFSLVQDQLHYR
jgi:hypothetical protein